MINFINKTLPLIKTEEDAEFYLKFFSDTMTEVIRDRNIKYWLIQKQAYFGWDGIYNIRKTEVSR